MAIKVGDVVAWDKVPSGAMVREERRGDVPLYTLRIGDWYRVVGGAFGWRPFEPRRPWHEALTLADWVRPPTVTIIALNVPADATAGDLRALAEVFEIREVVGEQFCDERWSRWCAACDLMGGAPWSFNDFTERLHKVGWRPGMTAEDAARLLAEVRDGEI